MAKTISMVEDSELSGRAFIRRQNSAASITLPFPTSEPTRLRGLFEVLRRGADDQDRQNAGEATPNCEVSRWVDELFLIRDDGSLGDPNPDLRFFVNNRPATLDSSLRSATRIELGKPLEIVVDFSQSTYVRNWPAYLKRRWFLRRSIYEDFVGSVIENAYGEGAEAIMQLDSRRKIWQFLAAIAARIHNSPFETYSRYRQPYHPFKSCDRALDSILRGDGGICSEKAMALYFIARAYGIPAEIVLGGEEAAASFPSAELRSLLDQPVFDLKGTEAVQRYWQHFAVLCRLGDAADDFVFCDVADSNIPFITWDRKTAIAYLTPSNKKPRLVRVTLEPIQLYYHRIADHQDIALDLYFAMEHFIDFIDLIQTIDNELGLFVSRDFWVGVICHRSRRERQEIIQDYAEFLRNAGRKPERHVCFAPTLARPRHSLVAAFRNSHAQAYAKITSIHDFLQRRIQEAHPRGAFQLEYVVLALSPSRW